MKDTVAIAQAGTPAIASIASAVSLQRAGLSTLGRNHAPDHLRVEDHPEPVAELRRLVRLARAYHKLNEGDELVTAGDMEAAMDAYRAATDAVSDEATDGEAPFWVGVILASEGREKEAVPYLQRAQSQNDRWADLLRRLPASGLMPADDELLDRLAAAMAAE